MNTTISPTYEVRETISSPDPEAGVIGFQARNKRMGRAAVLMKAESVLDGTVSIPADSIDEEEIGELAVLQDDTVLAMTGTEFKMAREGIELTPAKKAPQHFTVSTDHEHFQTFDRDKVGVTY